MCEMMEWCPRADSNHRHSDFQSLALPTELLGHLGLRHALGPLGSDAIGGAAAACPAQNRGFFCAAQASPSRPDSLAK